MGAIAPALTCLRCSVLRRGVLMFLRRTRPARCDRHGGKCDANVIVSFEICGVVDHKAVVVYTPCVPLPTREAPMDPSVLGPVSGSLMAPIDFLVDTPAEPLAHVLYDMAIGVMELGLGL